MKKIILLFIAIAIIILGGFIFFFKTQPSLQEVTSVPSPSLTEKSTPLPSIDNSDLRAGGSSYHDEQGAYVFLYPADYTLDTQDKQHIRIYKTGATQKGQTEMYDGVIIIFESIDLQGITLQEWVEASLKQVTADGISEISEQPKDITINNYPGVTYTIRGLGQATYYVLQKNSQSKYAVVIATSIYDPEQVGFHTEVDKILSTLEILK